MEEGAVFCSKCGHGAAGTPNPGPTLGTPPTVGPPPSGTPDTVATVGGLADNVAGALAYVTIIPAIIFLIVAPYNRSRFVRFHSFQSIIFCIVLVVLHVVLLFLPVIGWALSGLVSLAALALWIVLLIKAYSGQMWKLPVIGDFAAQQAGTV
jgi:uncharacterized membrane protein